MPIIVLALTHLGAFGLGGLSFWAVVRRGGPTLVDPEHHHEHHREATPVPHPKTPARPSWRTVLAVGLLVLSLFVVGFGYQQGQFQADQTAFRSCVSAWASDTTDTLEARVTAANRVNASQSARDNALDNVVLVVIGLRAKPPRYTDKDFGQVLRTFAAAKARLSETEAKAARTRSANPYPTLECRS